MSAKGHELTRQETPALDTIQELEAYEAGHGRRAPHNLLTCWFKPLWLSIGP